MPDVNEVVERLRVERSRIATGDVDAGLRRVERLADGRRRRRLLAAGAGTLGAVASIAALAVIVESPSPDIVVTNTNPTDTAPVSTTAEPTAATSPSTSVTPTAPTSAPTTTAGMSDTVDTPSTPSLGPTVAGRTTSGAFIPVTDQVRTAAGDTWIHFAGTWDDGFVVGGHESAFWSSDGIAWEPIAVAELPRDFTWGTRMANDERMVTAGVRLDDEIPLPAVASTTDLRAWSIQEIPVSWANDLPDLIRLIGAPQVTFDDEGWVAAVQAWVDVDWHQIATDRLGRPVGASSSSMSDEGVHISVDDGGTSEQVTITWSELEAEWGADVIDLVRGRGPVEFWAGAWDDSGAPTRLDVPQGASDAWTTGEAVATDDGMVVVRRRRTIVDDQLPVESVELLAGHRTPGGVLEWTVLEPPFDGRLRSAFALDGDLGVLATPGRGELTVYRVDTRTQRWTAIEVPSLPTDAREIAWHLDDVVLLDIAPLEPVASTTRSIEQNGLLLTFTFDYPNSTYEVREIATGEVVVGESIDIRDVDGSFERAFEYLVGGIDETVITDPATGAVVMDISAEQMEATRPPTPAPIPPESWLLASSDGEVWLSRALPADDDGQSGVSQAVVSGDRVLVGTVGDQWYVVDLR